MAPKRKNNVDYAQVDQVDWVRLTAFIDGEGTISSGSTTMNKGRCRTQKLYVQVSNTDLRIPAWCHRTFGGALNAFKGQGVGKPYAVWSVASLMAEEILRYCMPYFLAKREQAQVALLYRATFSKPGKKTSAEQIEARVKLSSELSRLKHELPEDGKVVIQ